MEFKKMYMVIEDYDLDTGETTTFIDMIGKEELLFDYEMTLEEYIEEIHVNQSKDISTTVNVIENEKQEELIEKFLNNGYQEDFKKELKEELKLIKTQNKIKNF